MEEEDLSRWKQCRYCGRWRGLQHSGVLSLSLRYFQTSGKRSRLHRRSMLNKMRSRKLAQHRHRYTMDAISSIYLIHLTRLQMSTTVSSAART